MKLSIAKDFSLHPDGRYRTDGKFCGEAFRDDNLIPAFENARKQNDTLEVSFDGVKVLPPSFLEEAFGGLVRKLTAGGVNFDLIEKTIKITAESPEKYYFIEKAINFMKDAAPKASK